MEDIERYHQMLIDMKEHYRIDVKIEMFGESDHMNSNYMHIACVLVAS
jgi:hypothetical protein